MKPVVTLVAISALVSSLITGAGLLIAKPDAPTLPTAEEQVALIQAQIEAALKVENPSLAKAIELSLTQNPQWVVDALQVNEQKKAAQKAQLGRDKWNDLKQEANVLVFGPADAPITIVEFNDYNCSYCRKAAPELTKLLEKRSDVKLIVRDFPIISPTSRDIAIVVLGALKQNKDKAHALHAVLSSPDVRGVLTAEKAIEEAVKLGLDGEALKTAGQDPTVSDLILRNMELGGQLKISGTPTFFINGERFEGYMDSEAMNKAIDRLSKK